MKNRHKKENKSTKKHRRIFWIFVFFLVVGIGVTSYILLFSAYTRRVEREAIATGTVQEEIYSFKSRRDLLSNEGLHINETYGTAVVLLILVLLINSLSSFIAGRLAKK